MCAGVVLCNTTWLQTGITAVNVIKEMLDADRTALVSCNCVCIYVIASDLAETTDFIFCF